MTNKKHFELSSSKEYLSLDDMNGTSEERLSALRDHSGIQTSCHAFVALLDVGTKKTNSKTYSKQNGTCYIISDSNPMESDLPLVVGGSY